MRSLGEPWFERSYQEQCTRVSLTYGEAKVGFVRDVQARRGHAPKTETKTN